MAGTAAEPRLKGTTTPGALKRRGIGKCFSSVFYWAATVSDSQSVRFISRLVFEATTCGEL